MIQNANYEFGEALNSSDVLPSILGIGFVVASSLSCWLTGSQFALATDFKNCDSTFRD